LGLQDEFTNTFLGFEINHKQMAITASKHVTHSINRSAGQHQRAMREAREPMWAQESMENAAACHQIDMDKLHVLYEIGCKYGISFADSRRLCDVAGLDFSELMKSTGDKRPEIGGVF